MTSAHKISPCLCSTAKEAAKSYVATFQNSGFEEITRYSAPIAEISGRPEGSVMTVSLRIAGLEFTALNGGPHSNPPRPSPSLARMQIASRLLADRAMKVVGPMFFGEPHAGIGSADDRCASVVACLCAVGTVGVGLGAFLVV